MNGKLDAVRSSVLDEIERTERSRTIAIAGFAVVEAGLLSSAIWLIDWSQRMQVVVFVLFLLTYLMTVLGMLALGSHVSRNTLRIIAAMHAMQSERPD
jgi:hypothetical protein